MVPNVLSIAGFDPSGGAGTLADIKTFGALRCYGMAVVTAVTAQNTQRVVSIHVVPIQSVAEQIDVLFADMEIAAIKIGMLATPETVETVAQTLAAHRPPWIVLDPVLAASSGDALAVGDLVPALMSQLVPLVSLVTPNLIEAAKLAQAPVPANLADVEKLAERLHASGFKSVLIKGGHLPGSTVQDVFFDGTAHRVFASPRVETTNTHGTGCTLSAAITASLAQGMDLPSAIEAAKTYVTNALKAADTLTVGHGPGPLQHFHNDY